MGPAFRGLLRIRGGILGVMNVSPNSKGDGGASAATVMLATSSGLKAPELKTALADFAGDLPESAARSIRSDPSWVAEEGPRVV